MQHDNVLKKLNFDQLTPSLGSGEVGGSAGKITQVVVRTKRRRFLCRHTIIGVCLLRTLHMQRVRANGLCVGSTLTARH